MANELMPKRVLLTCAILAITAFTASAQDRLHRVANYSLGKYGTAKYERFSFWVDDRGVPSEIDYLYGKRETALKLIYSGPAICGASQCFQVRFPSGLVLSVTPRRTTLLVADPKGVYSKVFRWEYEGPVNGIGTWCNVCTQNEKESIQLIRRHYLAKP